VWSRSPTQRPEELSPQAAARTTAHWDGGVVWSLGFGGGFLSTAHVMPFIAEMIEGDRGCDSRLKSQLGALHKSPWRNRSDRAPIY
jgi:hypothetical protein